MFFTASKIFWVIASPLNLITLLILVSVLVLLLFPKSKLRPICAGMCLFCSILFVILGIVPVGPTMLSQLENYYDHIETDQLPKKIDGIIVLGGFIDLQQSHDYNHMVLNRNGSRLTEFIKLKGKYPKATAVFTGGNGSLQKLSIGPSYFLEDKLHSIGGAPQKVMFEKKSRNTYENYAFTHDLIKPKEGENWILITSAFHMPRAVGIFCSNGWPVIPYPIGHIKNKDISLIPRTLNVLGHYTDLHIALREWFGIVAYRVFGKTKILLPPPTQNGDHLDHAKAVICT